MKGLHNHTALLILAITVTVLVAGIYVYMHHAVSASLERALAARDVVLIEEANKNNSHDLVSTYNATVGKRSRIVGAFIPSDKVVAFIETLEGLEKGSGSVLTISAIDADELSGTPPGTLGTVRAHVDAAGSWQSVMRAVMLAEILPYQAAINNVRVDTSVLPGDKAGKRTWHANFDLQAALIVPEEITQ